MREICIDLSNDRCSPTVFAGYVGEHNETKVTVTLPDRMLTKDITEYKFVFKNSENEVLSNSVTDLSDLANGNVSTILTHEHTIGGHLILNIVATVMKDGILLRRAKTPIVFLKVR